MDSQTALQSSEFEASSDVPSSSLFSRYVANRYPVVATKFMFVNCLATPAIAHPAKMEKVRYTAGKLNLLKSGVEILKNSVFQKCTNWSK